MSHSLKQTSSPTVGRELNECKEEKVCSATLRLHHTCKIELGHKYPTLLRKLELMSCTQWRDRGLVVLTDVLLIHSDNCCVFVYYQNVFSGLKQRLLLCLRGVLLMQTIFHIWAFSLQAAMSVRIINTSILSAAAMFGTHRELDPNSTVGCW